MSTQPDDKPWFIRQVHQRNWGDDDNDNDNVLPMRKPPVPEAEPRDDAGLCMAAADTSLGYRPTPDDPRWLEWTAPPSGARPASAYQRPDFRLPVLIGLVLLAVLLAFGAGWLLRDRTAAPVIVPVAVPAVDPIVAPAPVAKPTQVERPRIEPARVDRPVARMAEPVVIRPAAPVVVKEVPRKAVSQAKPARAAAVERPKPATVQPRLAVPEARTTTSERQRRAEELPTPRREPEASDARGETGRDDEDFRSVPQTRGEPSDLLASADSEAMQAEDERAMYRAERRREREQRRRDRVLPRCVGFQIYRPNVACRVGGPR